MARKPPKSRTKTYVSTATGAPVYTTVTLPKKKKEEKKPILGPPVPRDYRPPVVSRPAAPIAFDKLGPPSRDKEGRPRRIGGGAVFSGREMAALDELLLLPKKQQTKLLGKKGQQELSRYARAKGEARRARFQPQDTGLGGRLLDLFPQSRLWGAKPLGVTTAAAVTNIPLALQVIGEEAFSDLSRYFATRDREDAKRKGKAGEAMRVAGLPSNVIADIGEIVGKVAVGLPAGVYGAVKSPSTAQRDTANLANSLVQLPGILYGSVDPRAGDPERIAMVKQAYEESVAGFLQQYGPETSFRESFERSTETPVTSALTGLAVANPAARGLSIGRGLKAGLDVPEAVRASYRPYLRGPESERVLRLRGGPEGRALPVPIEYARSPLFRPIQRGYDAVSRALPFGTPVIAESKRAARAKRRGRQRGLRREIAQAQAVYQDIADLTPEEQKRLIFTREKPPGVPDEVWLGAMLKDIEEMLAGREIIRPNQPDPPSIAKAKRRVAYLQRRFDTEVQRRGGQILGDILAPLMKESTSLREQIRYRRRKGEDTNALEQQLYDVNARIDLAHGKEGVRPVKGSPEREQFAKALSEQLGTDRVGPLMAVADAMARAAEPDSPTKWYRTRLSETTVGTPEEMARLVAQGSGLWQRPGYSYSLVRHGENDPQPGDLVHVGVGEDGFGGEMYLLRAIDENGDFEVDHLGGGAAGVIRPNEVDRVVNLPHGRRVVTRSGIHGTISDVPIEREIQGTVTIDLDGGGRQEVWLSELAPEHAPIFYSHAQRVVEEKGQNKATPEQWKKLLEKEGVKADELEWSGINDWIQSFEEMGVKSIQKDEVHRFFANPLNAFNLAEVLFDGGHDFPARWGNSRGEGLVIRDNPDEYRELVMTLPIPSVFTHGHWSGITNPLLHIRFHEVDEGGERKLVIDELQSDWHQSIQKTGVRSKDAEALIEEIAQEIAGLHDRMSANAAKIGIESHDKVHDLWSQMMRDVQAYVEETPGTNIEEATRTSGLRDVTRVKVLNERLYNRIRDLRYKQGELQRGAPNAPFQKNRWLDLAMKRMVAYAAREGFDRVEWVDGHVQAVRYELFHSGIPGGEGRYESPDDHPNYPNSEDYMDEYTSASYSLATIPEPERSFTQERLFGETVGYEPDTFLQTWNAPWPEGRPAGVSMLETQPLRVSASDVDEFYKDGLRGGDYMTPESGEYADVLMRVVGRDGDDILATPTGVGSVEITGRKSHYGGDQEVDVTLYDRNGTWMAGDTVEVGRNYYLPEALDQSDNPIIASIPAQVWFDDVDGSYDRGWEWETDEDAFNEAVRYWEEEYSHEVGGGEVDFETIHHLGDHDLTDSGRGVVRFYDEVLPNLVRKLFKSDGVDVNDNTVYGRYSSEGSGVLTEEGPIRTWGFTIPPALKDKALSGQRLFQAAHHGQIKGAVEFLGRGKTALRLFESADVSTVLHELGHIGLFDMDPADIEIIDRDLAGGRSYARGEWLEEDHERFARAWERYFLDGKASSTSLRGVYAKLMQWMRLIYTQATGLGIRISPEVESAFNRRLGKVEVSEADIVRYAGRFDTGVSHWGAVLSQAKTDLEALETRLKSMSENGTDAVLQDERARLEEKRQEAVDEDSFQDYTERIEAIDDELQELEVGRVSRANRREKLLRYQMAGLEDALKTPKEDTRYVGAVNAANWLQSDRENILREIFGDAYDEVFEGRRQQTSTWLAARGVLDPADVGEGAGFMPMTRGPALGRSIKTGTLPGARKYGKASTRELNLHKRNEMMLWQLGDYQADPKVLMESWARAASFKWMADLRTMLYDIGEDVGRGGPKDGWYLIDPEGKPLPKHWRTGLTDEEIAKVLGDLEGGDDEGLARRLNLFAKSWLSNEPTDFVAEDGTYPGIRQVHPSVVHSLVMPYMPRSAVAGGIRIAEVINSLARLSLIYANPGYIPSNVFANSLLGMANSPWFIKDAAVASRMMVSNKKLAKLIQAEVGDASLSSMLPERGAHAIVQRGERGLAEKEQVLADNWARIAGWIGTARRAGYKGEADLIRLLEAKDARTTRDRDFISREATNAMIDFDRLSPFEKRYLQPVIFVWPFLRGAMAWPISYVMAFPERAGIAAAATAGFGEEQREELGPVPPYYEAMVPIDVKKKEGVGWVSNLGSISPIGPFADMVKVAYGVGAGAVTDEEMPAFNSLFGYVAPQYQAFILAAQGRNEFGGEEGLRSIASKNMTDIIPGWPILGDILDETKPAIYMEQDLWDTLYRRTFRFSPQQVNINVLNERAENRKVETPESKTNKLIRSARSSWSKANPTEPMPRSVEQSIRAFYAHSAAVDLKQEAIEKSGDWRPKRGERTPKLTPIQSTTVAYDILNAYFPEIIASQGLPDPEEVLRKYGEDAVDDYGKTIRRNMFRLKEKAQDAIREDKERKERAAA